VDSIVELSIEGLTQQGQDVFVAELRQELLQTIPDIRVERTKSDASTMDFGTILTIILTSATATATARGITNWLLKRNDVSISIRNKSSQVEARGLTSKDAVRIAEIMTGQ
jgi:hypothetical protein